MDENNGMWWDKNFLFLSFEMQFKQVVHVQPVQTLKVKVLKKSCWSEWQSLWQIEHKVPMVDLSSLCCGKLALLFSKRTVRVRLVLIRGQSNCGQCFREAFDLINCIDIYLPCYQTALYIIDLISCYCYPKLQQYPKVQPNVIMFLSTVFWTA